MERKKYYDLYMEIMQDFSIGFSPLGCLYQYADDNSITLPDWLTLDLIELFDLEYVNQHAGERIISNYILKLYKLYKTQSPSDPENDIITDVCSHLGALLFNKYLPNWDRVYKALYSDYNPIQNYDSTEEITRSGDDKTSVNTDMNQKSKISAFNSSTMQDNAEVDNQGLAANNYSKTDYNSKIKTTKKGNIGVTTSQQMIESELLLRRNNLFEYLMNDIDNIWVSNLYFYKN